METKKIDTAKAKAEMEAREIKKVSEAQIIAEAMRLGRNISSDFQLSELTENDDIKLSTSFGQTSEYDVQYYLLYEKNDLEGKALGIFKAYQYNVSNNIKSEDIVQKLEDGNTFLYAKPSELQGKTHGIWVVRFTRKQIVLGIKD